MKILSIIHSLRPGPQLIAAILTAMLPAVLFAAGNGDLDKRPSSELLGRASSYIEADTLLDRAVAALSVVANRYYAKPGDSTARHDAITALYQLGNIYSLRLLDYPKAYANLTTARMLAEEEGDDYNNALILLRLANIYNICYDESDQKATHRLLSEALDRAIAGDNQEVITRLAVNASILRVLKGGWGEHARDIDKIRRHRFPRDSRHGPICLDIINAMDAYFRADYPSAERLFKKILATLPDDLPFGERYEYGVMYLLQYVYERSGDYDAEESLLRKRLRFATERRLGDYKLYTYSHMANFFDRRNKPDSVKKYTYLYLFLKEELNRSSGLNKVKNTEMLRQIEKANDEVRELSVKRQKDRRRLTTAIAVIAIVATLLLTFIYLFFNLRRNHRILFQKNREFLDREEHLRMLISHKPDDGGLPPGETDGGPKPEESKADEESALLFPRILKAMEEDRAIYGLGFGIDDLAAILHVPQRSVSKAVNACSGTNFHAFLNGYRIREACRLMQTTDPAAATVEYIAEAVGFKSRTSFASLFKKATGLTPSEYWKMARKRQ